MGRISHTFQENRAERSGGNGPAQTKATVKKQPEVERASDVTTAKKFRGAPVVYTAHWLIDDHTGRW